MTREFRLHIPLAFNDKYGSSNVNPEEHLHHRRTMHRQNNALQRLTAPLFSDQTTFHPTSIHSRNRTNGRSIPPTQRKRHSKLPIKMSRTSRSHPPRPIPRRAGSLVSKISMVPLGSFRPGPDSLHAIIRRRRCSRKDAGVFGVEGLGVSDEARTGRSVRVGL